MSNEKGHLVRPVAVTMGCPAGIGPEVVLKALLDPSLDERAVVVGDSNILKEVAKRLKITGVKIRSWKPGLPLSMSKGVIDCLDVSRLSLSDIIPGIPTKVTGRVSYEYITHALQMVQDEKACAMATAPISKTGLRLAGIGFPGHTEILATLTNSSQYLMMMAGSRLTVTLCTIHVPLKKVSALLDQRSVLETIKLTWQALVTDFGISRAKIAVCGLNPHAGEGGMFGDEEEEIIAPAVDMARSQGINVTGPLPPDTVFYHASKGAYHAVVCQYHDQGLIPFKLLHFRDGVNVTCGLPIVRTSVDHGTAYDIAWKGLADHESMRQAISLAKAIYENRLATRKG